MYFDLLMILVSTCTPASVVHAIVNPSPCPTR